MRRALVLSAGILALGCTKDILGPEPESCPGDTAAVSVAIPPIMGPVFGWTPRCYMAWLEVWDSAQNKAVWVLSGRGNHIPSGLRYGEVPPGALQVAPSRTLQRGKTYTLIV